MYWTDWGSTPKITRANLDGSNPRPIVRGQLKWPNGLVIDAASQKLFWADAGLDKIEFSDLLVKLSIKIRVALLNIFICNVQCIISSSLRVC